MRWSKTIKLIVINISRYISVYFYKLAIVKFTQYSFWHFVRKIKYLNTLKFHQNMNKNEYTSLKYISIKLHFNNFYYINIALRFTHHLRLKATIFNQIYISIKLYIFTDRRIKKQTNPFRIYLYIFYFLHTDKQKITWKNFPQVETKPKKKKKFIQSQHVHRTRPTNLGATTSSPGHERCPGSFSSFRLNESRV